MPSCKPLSTVYEAVQEELPKLLPHGDTDHMVACFLYQNERD